MAQNFNIEDVPDLIDELVEEPSFSLLDLGDQDFKPSLNSFQDGSVACLKNEYGLEQISQPYVRILEQPQPKALRFRYMCEGRSAGSIPGINSTPENKTFPTIEVIGYRGPSIVIVSCVTVDPPHRPHPHNLVGKEGCKEGVCSQRINPDSMKCSFSNLGIQCVKKKDVEESLKKRKKQVIDPFQTGFDFNQTFDLNAVRLCFQVFIEDPVTRELAKPLTPVVSNPIYDKKATADLIICKLSHCSGDVYGGNEIILLCDKVTKDDIKVRFFEEQDGREVWEAFGEFNASDVHKQCAISFKAPRYHTYEIEEPVNVYIELIRPSDQARSDPRPYKYIPQESDHVKRKIMRLNNSGNVLRHLNMHTGGRLPLGTVAEQKTRNIISAVRPSEKDVRGEKSHYGCSAVQQLSSCSPQQNIFLPSPQQYTVPQSISPIVQPSPSLQLLQPVTSPSAVPSLMNINTCYDPVGYGQENPSLHLLSVPESLHQQALPLNEFSFEGNAILSSHSNSMFFERHLADQICTSLTLDPSDSTVFANNLDYGAETSVPFQANIPLGHAEDKLSSVTDSMKDLTRNIEELNRLSECRK